MSGCCPGACHAIEQKFGARVARRDALRYRKKGPAAAKHARRHLAISYPRDVWYVRLALAVENAVRAVTGNAFRTFLHAPREMDQLIRGSGFSPSVRRTTWVWCADVYVREARSARLR